MLRHLFPLLMFLLTAVSTGCAPTMRIRVLQAPPVNMGITQQLTLLQSAGRPRARDTILGELMRQTRTDGYFLLNDHLAEGIVIKVSEGSAKVIDGSSAPLAPEEAGLRLDVAEWDAAMKSEKQAVKHADGEVIGVQWVDYYQAEVVLVATLFHPSGKTFLAEREYRATAHDDYDKNNALLKASALAVSRLLQDITPRYATQEIRMDDDDDAQKPIIQMAEKGNIPDALGTMESYVQSNPNNASARYNLAVLLDASGRYAEALEHYDRAMALASKDYYPEMKQACLRRKSNQEALSQDDP